MGVETGSRSKFNSVPSMNFAPNLPLITFITITKLSVSFSIAQVCRMSQFQTLTCLRVSPLNRKTLIFVVFINATIDRLRKLFFEQRFGSYVIKYVYMFVIHHETLLLNCN